MKAIVLILAFLSFFSLSAMAENVPKYLVVWAKDGSRTTYKLSCKPKITFTETNMVVKVNEVEKMYEIDKIARFTYTSILLGDVNGNNMVDIGDAVSIVNYLVGKPSSTFIEKAANTNKNSQIDIGDAVTIVNFLVGKTANLSRSTRTTMDEKEPQ